VRVLKDTVYRKDRERQTLKSRIVVLDSPKRFMGPTHLISKYRKEIIALQEAAPLAPIAQLALALEASNGNIQSVLGRIQSSPNGVVLSAHGPDFDVSASRAQAVHVNGNALREGKEAHAEAQTAADELSEGALDGEGTDSCAPEVVAVGRGRKCEPAAEEEAAEPYLLGDRIAEKRVPTSLIEESCDGVGNEDTSIHRRISSVQSRASPKETIRRSLRREAPEPLTTERLSYQIVDESLVDESLADEFLADEFLADEFESHEAMRILLMRFRAHGERLEKENSRQAREGVTINQVR